MGMKPKESWCRCAFSFTELLEYFLLLLQVGIEIAKNLILAGPKQVTLYDPTIVSVQDLSKNFYVTEAHIGKISRADAVVDQLKDLNGNVHIEVAKSDDANFIAANYECVVVCDHYDKEYLVKLNKLMHNKNLGFVLAGNLGLYGYTFVDYGESHKIFDATG